MKSYIIQRLDDGRFYKWQRLGRGDRWVKDLAKAKRYSRLANSSEAITLMRSDGDIRLRTVDFDVHELSLSFTGEARRYPAVKRP